MPENNVVVVDDENNAQNNWCQMSLFRHGTFILDYMELSCVRFGLRTLFALLSRCSLEESHGVRSSCLPPMSVQRIVQ